MKLQERLLDKTPPSPFQKPAQSRNKQEWKKETAPVAKVRAHGHSRPYAFTVACTSAHTQRSKRRRFHAHKQRRISSLHKQAARAPSTRTYIHIPASRCFHNEQQRVGEQAEAFAQRTPERGPNSPDNNAKLRGGERQAKERAKKQREEEEAADSKSGYALLCYTRQRAARTPRLHALVLYYASRRVINGAHPRARNVRAYPRAAGKRMTEGAWFRTRRRRGLADAASAGISHHGTSTDASSGKNA